MKSSQLEIKNSLTFGLLNFFSLNRRFLEKDMPKPLSPAVEAALVKSFTALSARLNADPDASLPSPHSIAGAVSAETKEPVSDAQVRSRLKQFLGMDLYKQKYRHTIDPVARAFLMDKTTEIKSLLASNPATNMATAADLARDCKHVTHKLVTAMTVLVFLKEQLGTDLYDAKYGRGCDPVAEAFLWEEITKIKTQWALNPDADFSTVVDLQHKLKDEKNITLSARTIRTRLKPGLGTDLYSQSKVRCYSYGSPLTP